jgi:hypothetical protein
LGWAARLRAAAGRLARQLAAPVQAACLAALFLARRGWWLIAGQPGPPEAHASPSIARLAACRSQAEAVDLATKLGCDANGAGASPPAAACTLYLRAPCTQGCLPAQTSAAAGRRAHGLHAAA